MTDLVHNGFHPPGFDPETCAACKHSYPNRGEDKPHVAMSDGKWNADYQAFYLRASTITGLKDEWAKLYEMNESAPLVHVESLNCWLYDVTSGIGDV